MSEAQGLSGRFYRTQAKGQTMTTKTRIAKLEQRQAKPGRIIKIAKHDDRYFDATNYGGFDYSLIVASMSLDGCIGKFPELTRAQVTELEKTERVFCIDYYEYKSHTPGGWP